MNFEELQKTWQSHNPGSRITINADVLLAEVRRNQRHFRTMIFWRDAREVGTCGLMTAFFLAWGIGWGWWSLELLAACCFGVGAFFLVDRWWQRRNKPAIGDSLRACVEGSMREVDHQIWLLRNIFWWYLLPILIGLTAVSASTIWAKRESGVALVAGLAASYILVYGLTYWGVYWLNQYAVRKTLMPRRKELEQLLASLN
jgi:hypothetical protein